MGDEDGGGSRYGGGSEGRDGCYKVHIEFSLWKLNKRGEQEMKGRDISNSFHDAYYRKRENHSMHFVYH